MTRADRERALEPKITLDDVKHRAETVRDLAVTEAKQVAEKVVDESSGRTLFIIAGLVVVTASLAFYLGAQSVSSRAREL